MVYLFIRAFVIMLALIGFIALGCSYGWVPVSVFAGLATIWVCGRALGRTFGDVA
jgi:hypothetical protein